MRMHFAQEGSFFLKTTLKGNRILFCVCRLKKSDPVEEPVLNWQMTAVVFVGLPVVDHMHDGIGLECV